MSTREVEAGRAYILIRLRNQVSAGLLAVERQLMNFGRSLAYQSGAFALALKAPSIWFLKLAGDFEKAQVRMEHFVGDVGMAKNILAELQEFDVIAPMDFTHLVNATQLLLGFGDTAQNVVKHVKQLGDISGGDGLRFDRLALALGQVITAGRLMGTEARQFAEAGWNPLESLAKMTGKTTDQMRELMGEGKISPAMVFAALDHATGPMGRFHNLLVDQAQSLPGLVSVLWSYVKLTAMDVGFTILEPAKELVRIAISGMKWIREWVRNNKELVGTIFKVIAVVGAAAGVLFGIGMASMFLGNVLSFVRNSFWLLVTPIGWIFKTMFNLPGVMLSVASAAASLVMRLLPLIGFLFTTPTGWTLLSALLAGGIALALFKNRIADVLGEIQDFIAVTMRDFGRVQTIFMEGIFGIRGNSESGILKALTSGQYEKAYRLLLLTLDAGFKKGLSAAKSFFQGSLELLGRLIPGIQWITDAIWNLTSGVASAIANGNWGGAGVVLISFFSTVAQHIKSMFLNTFESVYQFLIEKFYNLLSMLPKLKIPTGLSLTGQVNWADVGFDAKELANSRDKLLMESKNRQAANQRMNEFQDRELWRAAQGQGGVSLDEQAQTAEDALRRALYSQRGADAKKAAQNRARAGGIASALDSALGAFGGNGVGTFSTRGATLLGSYNGPLQRIANNTTIANRHLERIANQENRDKQMEKLKELNRQRRAEGLRPLSFNAFQRGTQDGAMNQ